MDYIVKQAEVDPKKPEIAVVDYGNHNRNIEESFHRILKGNSWKKQRIVVIIPAAYDIPSKVALSHWSLIFPSNQAVFKMLAVGQEVGEAYNNCIEFILNNPELSQWEYILTIEHDNTPPADGVIKLLKRMEENPELHCIGGLYWTKGEMGVPHIWGDIKDPILNFRPQPPVPGKLIECYGTSMGFHLWRTSMFKDPRLKKPWFKTQMDDKGMCTQDLYFWTEAKKHGFRCAVDCGVLVGHYDSRTGINW